MVSLLLSLLVVLIDGIFSFLHLWETFTQVAHERDSFGYLNSPFGMLHNDESEVKPADVQMIYAFMCTCLNLFVTPALLATIIGMTAFAWAELPHLAAVSVTVVESLVYLLMFLVMVLLCTVAIMIRREIKSNGNKK